MEVNVTMISKDSNGNGGQSVKSNYNVKFTDWFIMIFPKYCKLDLRFPKMDLHINLANLIYAYWILFLLLQDFINFFVIGKKDYFSQHAQFLFR